MDCPVCGKPMKLRNRCTYNDVQMCIPCAYKQMPDGSPAKTQFERNYPELKEVRSS